MSTSEDFSIVRQDRFIEATRDSGYKSTESAISELVDNAVQARATSVTIDFASIDEGRGRLFRAVEVRIADNGDGMDRETLRRALRFGDSTRFDDRSGIGRFGMGLPNASVSQCRRVEVYSWRKGSKPIFTYIDVDLIAGHETPLMTVVPEPEEVPIPAPYAHLTNSPSGTLVVWKKCDRLDEDGKVDTLIRILRSELGRMFRYFLIRNFEMTINHTREMTTDRTRVGPFDPLYLMPQARIAGDPLATKHGDTLKFQIPVPNKPTQTSTVEVTFSLLPEEWHQKYSGTKKDEKDGNRVRNIDATAGFSIVRAFREIDLIASPYRKWHHLHRWYRVEIRFEPELDELFGVTHTKQHARITPGTEPSNRMEAIIKANETTLIGTIYEWTQRAAASKNQGPNRAEEIAKRFTDQLKPVESLADKSAPEVAKEIAAFVQERIAAGLPPESAKQLYIRLTECPVIIELEQLPGAPIYRTRTQGRTIVVMLNTSHLFYERVYQRLEIDSPLGKTGVELLLMSLARSEVSGSSEARDWYDVQRNEWSQNLKLFISQLPEFEKAGSAPVPAG